MLIVAVAAMALAGCGGSSSSSSDSSSPETEASKQFLNAKGKNKIAKFGEEASVEEREAASKVLEENMKARAAGEWAKQCDLLAAKAIKSLEKAVEGLGIPSTKGCFKNLSLEGEPKIETAKVRTNTMTGPIAALRVKGELGYALYHGTEKKDYAMPMEKEGGEWKVARLATIEIHD
jgi:hypothetical protein